MNTLGLGTVPVGSGSDGSQTVDTVRTLEKEEKFMRAQHWTRAGVRPLVGAAVVALSVGAVLLLQYTSLLQHCLPSKTFPAPISAE
jgi:hypothetical protein